MSKSIPVILAVSLILFFGCQKKVTYPSVSSTMSNTHTPGSFVWRDLVTKDPASAQRFYGEVFGWTFESLGDGAYTVIRHNGTAIGGIFPMPEVAAATSSAEWVNSISVGSVSDVAGAFSTRGGKVALPAQKLPGRGSFSIVVDPQGAILGLVHSDSGDPVQSDPPINGWLWTELWSEDPEASKNLYQTLMDYEVEVVDDHGRDYWLFKQDDTKCAGLITNPLENTRSIWMPYIRVENPAAITEKAEKAGAKVIAAPSAELRNGNVAVLMDPTGAPFVVQRWPMANMVADE